MHDPNIYAFIQARLNSSRLPNKVLASLPFNEIEELSVLEHIHKRLTRVMDKERIVFLIPDDEPSLKLYMDNKGWNSFLGSSIDVRSRFYLAGKHYKADVILRLTGDNPIIDLEAIEVIIDSWLDPYNSIDLMYSLGLPLGMAIESFRFSALESSLEYLEQRHIEHITLAMKENPTQYRIGGVPSLSGIDIPLNIRLTIDESIDLKTIFKLISIFLKGTTHSGINATFLNAQEILNLYKNYKPIFMENEKVEQIRFPLPEYDQGKPIAVIVYGSPNQYGSGHKERCQLLAGRLTARGFHVVGISVENSTSEIMFKLKIINQIKVEKKSVTNIKSNNKNLITNDMEPNPLTNIGKNTNSNFTLEEIHKTIMDINPSFMVWDLRDIHPPSNPYKIPGVVIDNYFESKFSPNLNWKKLDLLPHPQSSEWIQSPKILHPWISSKQKLPNQIKDKLLVYSGSLGEVNCNFLDKILKENFPDLKIYRIGQSGSLLVKTAPRLTRYEWWKELLSSKYFLSYFGQGLFEAIHLGLSVATYSISLDHKELSIWMNDKFGIPFWGDTNDLIFSKDLTFARIQDLEMDMDRTSWLPIALDCNLEDNII